MLTTTSKDWRIDDCASTEEWLEKRKDGIGASALGTILGLSHYKDSTPMHLYSEMMGFIAPKKTTEAMQTGHDLEPWVALRFARATKAIIMEESAHDFLCIDNAHPWRRISPDRFFWPEGTPAAMQTVDNADILECKVIVKYDETSKFHKTVRITRDNFATLYPEYMAQIQYQMGVCRKKRCFIAWIDKGDPDLPFDYLEVPFNEKYFESVMKPLDDFWNNHVLKAVPPEVIMTEDDAILRYPSCIPASKETADDDLTRKARRYKVLDSIAARIKAEQEDIKKDIRERMGMSESLYGSDGKLICTWKAQAGKTTFDDKALKADDEALWEKYARKSADTRTLRFSPLDDSVIAVKTNEELDTLRVS